MKLPRLSGLPIAIAGVLLLSPDSLVIRLVSADRLIVLFWRGLMMAIGFAAVAGLSRGSRPAGQRFRCGRPALVAGLLLGAANVTFVFSITSTDVANTFIIAATAPLFAAILSRLFLRETVARRSIVASVLCVMGLAAIFLDSVSTAHMGGDLIALAYAVLIAGSVTAMRASDPRDIPKAFSLGSACSAVVALPFVVPWNLGVGDAVLLALTGAILLPAAFLAVARATEALPAPVVALVLLLETLIAPLLVWLWIGEEPTVTVLLAGTYLLAVLVGHGVAGRGGEDHPEITRRAPAGSLPPHRPQELRST